ncbi:MAG: HAD-IA family hydrolase [Chloroflexi bacterium]|nr:HAD-IA family hydrolase [Chloroflexota bacterium]
MIKAVFFDWSNTLARYVPTREQLQSQALHELGLNISPQQIAPGLARADRFLFEETISSSVRQRSPAEQASINTCYQQIVLGEAGIDIPADSLSFAKLTARLNELYAQMRFVLFDDVLPAMKILKGQNRILALVTNMNADMRAVCRELGLAVYLDFVLTSSEVGASKPQPKIFLTALEYAGVAASEAVHVGDQYDIDVVGALSAGIRPILLDRNDLFQDITDCPRIHSLTEVAQYLN